MYPLNIYLIKKYKDILFLYLKIECTLYICIKWKLFRFVRGWSLWKHYANFFPIKVIKKIY